MMNSELQKLGEQLEAPAHLVVWEAAGRFEVVAVEDGGFNDAFPLPLHVQSAAAEAGMILNTTTAARLEIEQLPEDFWEQLAETGYGDLLTVSVLGRSGCKYLEVFHAVSAGGNYDRTGLKEMKLEEGELLKVVRWMREQKLFDHRSGDVMMEILTQIR